MQSMKKDVTYHLDGTTWTKTVYAEQCEEKTFLLGGRCQGVKGHSGDHWSYSLRGEYQHTCEDGGCSSTPPGHASYVNPVDKFEERALAFSVHSEVTEPELIARLNRGEYYDGESIDRPISDEEYKTLLKMDRLRGPNSSRNTIRNHLLFWPVVLFLTWLGVHILRIFI